MLKFLIILFFILNYEKSYSLSECSFVVQCPSGIGSMKGEKPKLLTNIDKISLIACGFLEEKINKTTYVMSEFDVYSINKETNIYNHLIRYSALDLLIVCTKANGLTLTKFLYYKNERIPYIRREIVCNSSSCTVLKKNFIFDKKNYKNLFSAKKEQKFYSLFQQEESANNLQKQEIILTEFLLAALSQNKNAINFFFNKPKHNLLNSSSLLEQYNEGKKLIKEILLNYN